MRSNYGNNVILLKLCGRFDTLEYLPSDRTRALFKAEK